MNLYIRLLFTVLRALFEPKLSTRTECTQSFRVWPNDIDAFGHMNNGRYLQIMDVSRMRWLVRTGTVGAIRRRRWAVALGGNLTRYRHPLRLWRRYSVSTRLVCWDRRWFFLEHAFHDDQGRQVAIGISRAAFRGEGRWVPTAEVMNEVEAGIHSPPVPRHLKHWMRAEEAMSSAANHSPMTPNDLPEVTTPGYGFTD